MLDDILCGTFDISSHTIGVNGAERNMGYFWETG